MKRLGTALLTLALLAPLSAFADQTGKEVLRCVSSANAAPAISMTLTVFSDSAADFLILNVTDKEQTFRMFNQVAAGEVTEALATGNLIYLMLDENFSQDEGVIRNAGVFVANTDAEGAMAGMLIAHGNIYSLSCQKL